MGRIHVKFAILGLTIILLFSTAPLAHGWSEGKSWAYSWTGDWNVTIRHNVNETHSLNVDGKYAEAYMIQYAGKDSAGYKFRYEGGYYTYGNMRMKINDTTPFGSYENSITAKIKEIWIDFDGEFHLVKVGDTSNSYYGIKDFSVHIFTRVPLSIFVNSTSSTVDSGTHVKRVSGHVLALSGTFNVYLNASYSSPIPYLPASPDFKSADIFSSTVNYSAHISYDTHGFNYWFTSPNLYQNVSLTKKDSFSINNTHRLGWFTMLKKGNVTYYPALIKHIPEHILELFMDNSIFYKNNLICMVIPSSNTGGDKGVYSPSDGFYSEINATSISYEFPFDSVPCKVSGTSQSATDEYVKNLENNAPQMFGEQPENGNAWILPLIIIVVSVAVALSIAVIFAKRKRDIARERTQPVENEYPVSSDENEKNTK